MQSLSLLSKEHQHHKWHSKSHGYYLQIAWLLRTSSWRSICLYPGKNRRSTIIVKKFEVRMSRYLDYVYRSTNGQIRGPVWKIQSFLCSEIVRPSSGRTFMGKAIREKFHLNTVGEKFQLGNAYSLNEKKDHSCLCSWDDTKLAGKKQNIDPMLKILFWKNVDLGEPTSFLDHVYLGCIKDHLK